jgi:hypothetical protein
MKSPALAAFLEPFKDAVAEGAVVSFLQDNGVQILNVARPRASKEPSVAQFVIERFDSVFRF